MPRRTCCGKVRTFPPALKVPQCLLACAPDPPRALGTPAYCGAMEAPLQSQHPCWASGDPAQNAAAFLEKTRKKHRSLGSRAYYAYVQAVGCAYMHAALMGSPPGAPRAAQLDNILSTAEAVVVGLAAGTGGSDSGDEPGSEDEGEGQAGVDRLPILRRVLQQAQQQQQLAAVHPVSSSRRVLVPPLAAAAAAAAPPAFKGDASPLPPDALLSIVARLDAATRARAAASCKRLRWAVQQLEAFAAASPALVGYLEALQLFRDACSDWSDGSIENALGLLWPADGSDVAGDDLQKAGSAAEFARIVPAMGSLFDMLAGMLGDSGAPGGREGALARVRGHLAEVKGKVADKTRAPPHPKSSPLAAFVASQPVTYTASSAAVAAPDIANSSSSGVAAPSATGPGSSGSSSDAPPAAAVDRVTTACCNAYKMQGLCATPLHLDGDLMALGFVDGWKGRDPGLGALTFHYNSSAQEWSRGARLHKYSHGLFNHVTAVCADAANGLIWCAADGGERVKAFRAPEEAAPSSTAAACNRGQPNGLALQYTLASYPPGAWGDVVGLHVQGTRVMAVKGSGRLCVWDIADLAPAAEERISPYTEDSDSQSGEEGDYRGDIDFRDAYEIELEVTKGVRPNVGLYQLQAPDKGTLGSSNIRDTCLLPAAGGSSQSLVALYKSGLLVVHDLATGQATQQYLGHLFDVTDICAAPAAWQQASLFATSADSGDVKLWDMRSRLGVPALTLGNPRASALQAVALAAATSSSSGVGSSSSSSSSQLGGGMLCFTGGANESVWCFDLRRGQAQALYELSTGNTAVQELAWHEGSNTLVASCEGLQEDRLGYCDHDEYITLTEAWGSGEPPEDYYRGLDHPDELYWPTRAQHAADTWRCYYNEQRSCMLAYRFSATADKEVPCSEEPHFRGGGGSWW